jgi:hypothetical protein
MEKLTKEEENNLSAIFTYARQHMAHNEAELIGIINFKDALWKKLFPKETFAEKTTKALNKKK